MDLSPDEFEEEKVILNMEEMDALIGQMREAKEDYEEKKRASSASKAILDNLQLKVSQALEDAGKDSYVCTAGTVSIVKKLAVRVPATVEDKLKFFKWLEENEGKEVAEHYMSVNSQALNALYNTLNEEYARQGKVLDIDGLDVPTYRESLSFRRSR